MKHSIHLKNAFLTKAFLIFSLIFSIPAFAQTKWEASGNNAANTDFIGTNNNVDFIIKTNGSTAAKIKADGSFLLKSLESHGTGIAAFDNDGKLLALPFTGDHGKALLADGTWGSPSFTFAGGKEIIHTPPSGGDPEALGWGIPATDVNAVLRLPYCSAPNATGANIFAGMMYSYGTNANGGYLNVLRTGFDGANGIVDMAGLSNGTAPSLLLNYYCGRDVNICTGTNGGVVAAGKNFEVGFPNRNVAIAVNVKAIDKTGLLLTSEHTADFGYNVKLVVNRDKTKALTVYNTTKNLETFVVNGDGSVGIGTTNTDGYLLSVNGNLRAKDIMVRVDWSDFVFEKNYTRMGILEKEKYYEKEKHLPNITSGKEIETNGLQVGTEMSGMMQNIEENTLDIASLYKLILQLQKENTELKQSLKNIENKN